MKPKATDNNDNNLGDNWSDNLLIKDKTGKMRSLTQIDSQATDNHQLVVSPVTLPAPAPEDDKFMPFSSKISGKKADFAFHPDDAEELAKISDSLPKDTSRKYSLEKIVDKIISKHGLKLAVTDKEKFNNILFDFFRNRKNAIVIRDLLSTQVLSEQKVLSEEMVNDLISVSKAIKDKIDKVGGLVVQQKDLLAAQKDIKPEIEKGEVISSETQPAIADVEKQINVDFKEGQVEDTATTQTEIQKILSKMDKDEAKDQAPVKKIEPKPIKEEVKDKPEEPKPAEIDSLPKVSRPSAVPVTTKKQVSDVLTKEKPEIEKEEVVEELVLDQKPKATLTGPVEELQNLNLDNFRHLGNSPSQQTAKLVEKINVLEKDSVTKKAQGIEAWRNSQVYRMYLELGELSLNENKDVAAIITQYQNQKKPTLSLEEFSAISDLNKRLRF